MVMVMCVFLSNEEKEDRGKRKKEKAKRKEESANLLQAESGSFTQQCLPWSSSRIKVGVADYEENNLST